MPTADTWYGHPVHPAAALFPLLEGEKLDALRRSILEHGLLEPPVFLDGVLLDGRNRIRVCDEEGIAYERKEYEGDVDPADWIYAANFHRRQLTKSQAAMVASDWMRLQLAARAAEKASEAVDAVETQDDTPNAPEDASRRPAKAPKLSEQAAKLAGVGSRSVESAQFVQTHGVEGLADQVRSGNVSVDAARKVATLPADEQLSILQGVEDAEHGEGSRVVREALNGAKKRRQHDAYYTPDALAAAVVGWLLKSYRVQFPEDVVVWEPHAGHGAFVRALRDQLPSEALVVLSDINPDAPALHEARQLEIDDAEIPWCDPNDAAGSRAEAIAEPGDFLDEQRRPWDFEEGGNQVDWVVGNPPFVDAIDHVRRARDIAQAGVAFLLRLNWLGSATRHDFFQEEPPTDILILSNRPSFGELLSDGNVKWDGSTDAQEYAVFVWLAEWPADRYATGDVCPRVHWLRWKA
jgi:hypothetical protein